MITFNNNAILSLRIALSQASVYPGTDKMASKFALTAATFLSVAQQYMATSGTAPQGSMQYRQMQGALTPAFSALNQICINPFGDRSVPDLRELSHASLVLKGHVELAIKSTGNTGFKVPGGIETWIADIIDLLEMAGFVIEFDMTDSRV